MPELPDVTVYIEALEKRIVGDTLLGIRLANPFVLRTVQPRPAEMAGRRVVALRRVGKRIAMELEEERFIVVHLMVAGRFRWLAAGAKVPGKIGLAAFDFTRGTLVLTEAGTKRRASIHLLAGADALAALDPGGMDVMAATEAGFAAALRGGRHTLKRRLTDPHVFSGIGNAYSDEILHRAKLSPVQLTTNLSDGEVARLFAAVRDTLAEWTERLRREAGDGFPEKVRAFHPEMAVHGKYGQPCPVCGAPVQRIVYAENETHYCARCQTGGRLLADRSLSRLLKGDWPKSIDELG
ncbi:DNA-formamidopyrimidine glycosylase family protein [Longimicrobium sp.]|uniref:DNA-formamidopyrimidine glycosylase family protein n=1 Tax=Longimicrobium sp. TaxID=2029185 RepID=UPI002C52464C|nr:DNA-formamidopyrimidine glycosylase family protein [Longimicrobium sp.]HSU13950.1 DNA-formamidopyrimidine glycosylase family protein [Longimicrobium sp.]